MACEAQGGAAVAVGVVARDVVLLLGLQARLALEGPQGRGVGQGDHQRRRQVVDPHHGRGRRAGVEQRPPCHRASGRQVPQPATPPAASRGVAAGVSVVRGVVVQAGVLVGRPYHARHAQVPATQPTTQLNSQPTTHRARRQRSKREWGGRTRQPGCDRGAMMMLPLPPTSEMVETGSVSRAPLAVLKVRGEAEAEATDPSSTCTIRPAMHHTCSHTTTGI